MVIHNQIVTRLYQLVNLANIISDKITVSIQVNPDFKLTGLATIGAVIMLNVVI